MLSPSVHRHLLLSIWPHPQSILHFINVTLTDLARLGQNETTLTDDCPFQLSLFCVLVYSVECARDRHTHYLWVPFFCMVICDMTGNIKEPEGEPIYRVQIKSLPFIIFCCCLSIFFICGTFTSTFVPAFSQLTNGPAASIHAGGGRRRIQPRLSRAHTHASAQMLPLVLPTTAFCSFNVCKLGVISPLCIMVQRWNHQRKASLTKWEQQIVCSIRREQCLSDNLIGSH